MDSKSLDEIMSERETPVETVEQPAIETTDATARDEKGRFAPKEGQAVEVGTAEAPEIVETAAEPGTVPQKALHASREREKEARQEAENLRQKIAQMEGQINLLAQQRQQPAQATEQAPAPEPWDPGYTDYVQAPLKEQMQQQREQFSLTLANDKFGAETVEAAYNAMRQGLQQDPSARSDYQRIMASPHPYGELVTWHQRRQALAEVGTDPKAYREKVRAEIMAELQSQPPATQQQPAAQRPMPTSFANARNEGPRTQATYSGPKPLSEIMDR